MPGLNTSFSRRCNAWVDRSARLVEAVERGSVDVAVYVTEAAATEGTRVGGLPLTWHAVPGWERPVAPGPIPMSALARPSADPATRGRLRRRTGSAASGVRPVLPQ
ncbi:hypothetical protein P2Q00_06560 [Streptomyces coacervatus]|uniref:hypothetical protein n=1 Tax=Streptomyces coacervatus TaxID=647381 RepID=UPI0023DB07B8|nr:hypothetical protein [Streptomyces coacervatus]MDF2265104.1 hypothetical protein [Streptomyces coacervatus]